MSKDHFFIRVPGRLGSRRRWGELTKGELVTLFSLCRWAGKDGKAWPSLGRMAAFCGLGVRTIRYGLRKLTRKGDVRDLGVRPGWRTRMYEVVGLRKAIAARSRGKGKGAALDMKLGALGGAGGPGMPGLLDPARRCRLTNQHSFGVEQTNNNKAGPGPAGVVVAGGVEEKAESLGILDSSLNSLRREFGDARCQEVFDFVIHHAATRNIQNPAGWAITALRRNIEIASLKAVAPKVAPGTGPEFKPEPPQAKASRERRRREELQRSAAALEEVESARAKVLATVTEANRDVVARLVAQVRGEAAEGSAARRMLDRADVYEVETPGGFLLATEVAKRLESMTPEERGQA